MATNDSTPRTIEIQLTKGYVAIVDEQDADLALYKWKASGKFPHIYAYMNKRGKTISMHRLILERITGRVLQSIEYGDHKNHVSLDNTRKNLRITTPLGNSQNRSKSINNKSGFKGVYKVMDCNSYAAEIRINGKRTRLGCYKTAIEAGCAYNLAAVKYHGEFASLNDIDGWQEVASSFPTTRLNGRNSSGFAGVAPKKGKWCAYVYVDKKVRHLGTFKTPEEANEFRQAFLRSEV